MKNNNNNNNSASTSNRNSNINHGHNRDGSNHNQKDTQHDRRRPTQSHRGDYDGQQQQPKYHAQQQQQQQTHNQNQPQQQQHQSFYKNQRERSGQRSQYPDSSMGRDNLMNRENQINLGSVRFTPGNSTRELQPIETKADPSKKFTGRCRLFVGNIPHNTTEDKLRAMFERFGEIGEVFLGPKSAFAFVKMDTRQNAEAARDALDCSVYENRTLRVRLAAHAAAIRIKHLSPQVTNELLAYAFRYFGEIERAVVVVDDKGKSTGEGIIEYSKKQSAHYAIKRCQQECFMLTASPQPVLVEPYDQQDEEEGLPEKSVNRNSIEFKEQRDVGPRFAEQGSFEHTYAMRWKELYDLEKQKRDRLEQEIQDARKCLQDQIEILRAEHHHQQLKNQLQELEDNRSKLQQLKEQHANDAQQREELRRQQDMILRQREEAVLRRQQLGGDPIVMNQQDSVLRMQANLDELLRSTQQQHQQASSNVTDEQADSSQTPQQTTGSETESQAIQMNPMNMIPTQMTNAPMMGMNQQAFMPMPQQMGVPPPNQQNMFTAYMPPAMQMGQPMVPVTNYSMMPQQQQQQQLHQTTSGGGGGGGFGNRQQKFGRPQYNQQGNNVQLPDGGRPRKRGRY